MRLRAYYFLDAIIYLLSLLLNIYCSNKAFRNRVNVVKIVLGILWEVDKEIISLGCDNL